MAYPEAKRLKLDEETEEIPGKTTIQLVTESPIMENGVAGPSYTREITKFEIEAHELNKKELDNDVRDNLLFKLSIISNHFGVDLNEDYLGSIYIGFPIDLVGLANSRPNDSFFRYDSETDPAALYIIANHNVYVGIFGNGELVMTGVYSRKIFLECLEYMHLMIKPYKWLG